MQLKTLKFRECCFKNFPEHGRKAVWELTHECYTKCAYCFQAKKRAIGNMQVLSDNDIEKIINKFNELSIKDVVISGGEIFHARHALSKVVGELKKNGINFSFSTNYLIDDSFIDFLIDLSPKALNLSFDPVPNTNGRKYKRKIRRVRSILDKCGEENINIKITSVITNKSLEHTENFFELLNELVETYPSLSSVYFTNPYDIGYIKLNVRPSNTALTNWFRKEKLPDALSSKIHFVNFHRFNNQLQSCQAGKHLIHIEPNGNVYPCHLFANLPKEVFLLGNLINDTASYIKKRLNSFHEQAVDAINDYKNNEQCEKCRTSKKCFGGCVAEIVSLGQLIEPQLTCKYISPKKVVLFKPSPQSPVPFKSTEEDLTSNELNEIVEYIKQNIRTGHDLAHGFDHVDCVVKYARYIANKEGANLRIVIPAAYFHDFEPRQKLIFQTHTEVSAQKAVLFLKRFQFSDHELNEIYNCIDTSSYGSASVGHHPASLEAQCVRDADWLDAIGARGIARVFAFGSAHGCAELGKIEWDIDNPPKKKMSLIGPDPSPIYHFFSKLLWIKNKMATKTGKRLAQVRHDRLVRFLKEYYEEMNIL